jgi:RHS repeat-associated protein
MADDKTAGSAGVAKEADKEPNPFAAPSVSLPKGGGAIKGIGEKFGVNPVNGTGTLSVPVFTTPGRSKFSPNLSLSYDSGAGNGPFGFGWHLSVPHITRKTDKGLPRYCDEEESDVFILSEAEDLVPVLLPEGDEWRRDTFAATNSGEAFTVQRYRPRIEGLFARIERWRHDGTGEIFWRSISKDNITSLYGVDSSSRIADPADPSRVFTWLLARTYDDRGNVAVYEYKPEDGTNVPPSLHEQNRQITANRYLKRIKYGNRTPYYPNGGSALPADWCFEVVFDYGEHDPANPSLTEVTNWRCRPDPFSRYRSTFEVRTYRICSRVLMFHHFPLELSTPDYLVRSTNLTYSIDELPANHSNPVYAYVQSVKQVGYLKQTDGTYHSKGMPPLEFTYTQAEIDETIHFVDSVSLENLPSGVDGSRYQWVDLDSEGSPGILSKQGNAWFYKRNVSSLPAPDGSVAARFEPAELVTVKPSLADLGGGGSQQLMDLAGDGQLSLVQFARPVPGYYEHDADEQWETFTPFASCPNIDWKNPNLRTVDLDGDGFGDILITENEVFTWYPSLAKGGFGRAETVRKPFDEDRGPALIFADGTQSIYLADASGDGLKDLVRIRNGEICYWPNLGYGRFGAKITMDNPPLFDSPDLFDQKRVRPADIDGTGTMDIIYLGSDSVTVWVNHSGNGFGPPQEIPQFPASDDVDSVSVADLLGNGTACLVWSSPLPSDSRRPLRYIDLMGGQKPHLLVGVKNNLGTETRVQYAPSTKFYLADRAAGQPWVTRLSFPVHVVERTEAFDWISRNHFVTRYAYHHGFFDGIEREFRGFGMVEQQDTEELGALSQTDSFPDSTNVDASSYVPPVLTKTWFHTGAFLDGARISRVFAEEYYRESDLAQGVAGLTDVQFEAMKLGDTILPDGLTSDEAREAVRALKGAMLRQEIYALDATSEAGRPYIVSEKNYTVKWLQPLDGNRHAVFFTHARESIDFHYERKLYDITGRKLADPHVTHSMVLAVDAFGNELQSAAIGYGRRHPDPEPTLTADDRANQSKIHVTCTESSYTNPILTNDAYRTPLPAEARTYELINVTPAGQHPEITNLFDFDEMVGKAGRAGDGQYDLPYEDIYAKGATANSPYRRLIKQSRSLYRKDDLTGALTLGTLESRAFAFQNYQLAFTPGLLALYQRNQQNLLTNPASILRDQGGYVLSEDQKGTGLFPSSDPSDCWWIPSGRIFFSTDPMDTPTQELTNAITHFFLPRRFQDPFGNNSTVLYDANDLLILETADALQNKITTGERDTNNNIANRNDYRLMAPALVTDPNGNRVAVAFDTLGSVAGTAIMGKPSENLGDSLTGFQVDLQQADIDQFFGNPQEPMAGSLLGNATSRIIYDLDHFHKTSAANPNDPAQWKPVFATIIARETHVSDLGPNQQTKLQIGFSYSDGFGREIQKKVQTEPGPVGANQVTVNPRWVGSGWTVFNNKSKPVRRYEPFFDDTHDFKYGITVGVSPILFYDPLGRVVATLRPNQTWEKVVFDPWHQESWDANDTVLIANPSSDADAGAFFQRIPKADYFPTWYGQRNGGQLGAQEQDAATKAAAHAETPTGTWFETLGRTVLTVADNAAAGKYATRVELDIEGKQRSVTDALGRKIVTYNYDMVGTKFHQNSADAGERWMLSDAMGKPLIGWNSRGFQTRHESDPLRRPIKLFVNLGVGPEHLAEKIVYGEGQPNDQAANLRGRAFQSFDGAGVVINSLYDFKGNLLNSSRQLLADYKEQVDWSQAQGPAMENETYASTTTFDALNRPLTLTPPDGSVIRPIMNEANLLEQLSVNLRGSSDATLFVTNIDYNAKGQRELIEHGNGAQTAYDYDPQTFRLTHLKTTRKSGNAALQDLSYSYDPAGNITQIQDAAQQTIYFNNQVVTPSNDYTYDAIYRLIYAQGREHIGQVSNPQPEYDSSDSPRVDLPHPNDGSTMRNYAELYDYDAVGNFLQMVHQAAKGNWTRRYSYSSNTLAPVDNRLQSTSLPGDPTNRLYSAKYVYDPHGNMVQMPHLPIMSWDFKDQLQASQRQVVNNAPGEKTYYVYDAAGQRVRKITETASGTKKNERIYLGGFEVYREYGSGGNPTLERQTLHVMDDKQRIALVENLTQGSDGSPPQLIRYQFSNHLGSASLELDATAKIISYEEYYPYGSTSYRAVDASIKAAAKRYRYTGKERDEETGFTYHGARYYAPWLGSWTACDPQGMTDGVNLYIYARNAPVTFVDPSGTQSIEEMEQEYFKAANPNAKQNLARFIAFAGGTCYDPDKASYEVLWSSYLATKNRLQGGNSNSSSSGSQEEIGPSNEPYDRRHRFIKTPVDDPLQYEMTEVYATADEAEEMQMSVDRQEFLNRGYAALAAGTSATPGSASERIVPSRAGAAAGPAPHYDATSGAKKPEIEPYAGMVPGELGVPPVITGAEGRMLADSTRRRFNVPEGKRNIGLMDANIEGKRIRLQYAISGSTEESNPPGAVGNPTARRFKFKNAGAQPRGFDTEVKLLENLAESLTPDSSGVVNLFTERQPCPSCAPMLQEFSEAFPNIQLNVTWIGPTTTNTNIKINLARNAH